MNRWLSTSDVAQLMGVSPSTVKRWADQGILRCHRTEGSHRRFLQADVTELSRSQGQDPWRDLLIRGGANQIKAYLLTEKFKGESWETIAQKLMGTMGELGERWRDGTLSIAKEHEISEKLSRALTAIAEEHPPATKQRFVLATAEGENHVIGLRFCEIILRDLGYSVTLLPPPLPVGSLIRFLREEPSINGLAVCASGGLAPEVLEPQAKLLHEMQRDLGIPLILGGHGQWPSLRNVHRTINFEDFTAAIKQVVEGGDRVPPHVQPS